jgi:hypothetical protein
MKLKERNINRKKKGVLLTVFYIVYRELIGTMKAMGKYWNALN